MPLPIKYYNNKFDIDGIQFPNSVVKNLKSEYACDENIKELFYQEGSGQNKIVYNDETVKILTDFDPLYNELILLASYFEFEYKELLFKEQEEIINKPTPSLKLKELFENGISVKEQSLKIKILEEIVGKETLTNEFYFDILNKLKKGLLKESDWTQLPDVQLSLSDEEKEAWINYRISLRKLDAIKNPLKARLPLSP